MRHRRTMEGLALACALLIFGSGCLRPSKDRALRDLEAGRVAVGGVSFEVQDNLAAVHSSESGALTLWASAPRISVVAAVGAGATAVWTLEVHNVMASAELVVSTEPAVTVGVEKVATELGTRKKWSLSWENAPAEGFELSMVIGSPTAEEMRPFRFAIFSDVQRAIDEVGDILEVLNGVERLDFCLGAGDLTNLGEGWELENFQNQLMNLDVPYFATLGNHELGFTPAKWHDYFGPSTVHFSFHGVHFSLLDSGSATLDPLIHARLAGWLKSAREKMHIVAMHIPPLDPVGVRGGSFASRNEAAAFLQDLVVANVDLTLYGHIHTYESFENAGIEAHISGGGGALPMRFDGIGRHVLVVDVDPATEQVDVQVVRVD